MKYTNRTCNQCGVRNPQPEMIKKIVYTETGRSRKGVSAATGLGLFVGHKGSANAVKTWFFNSGQRTYQRKKQVWMCKPCSGYKQSRPKGFFGILFSIIMMFVYFVALAFVFMVGIDFFSNLLN
jgi:hypothetical protein